MSDREIREFGPDVVWGMPDDQKIKMTGTRQKNITVWEEFRPIGTQHLKSEDIIEELKNVPDFLSKYIALIVLSPFDLLKNSPFATRNPFASFNAYSAEILFPKRPEDRNFLKTVLSNHLTLQHEAGHIIDGNIRGPNRFYSTGMEWLEAMCLDTKVKHTAPDLPKYYISENAESTKEIGEGLALMEDFADSVMFFSDERRWKKFLKREFPNRYKTLDGLLK